MLKRLVIPLLLLGVLAMPVKAALPPGCFLCGDTCACQPQKGGCGCDNSNSCGPSDDPALADRVAKLERTVAVVQQKQTEQEATTAKLLDAVLGMRADLAQLNKNLAAKPEAKPALALAAVPAPAVPTVVEELRQVPRVTYQLTRPSGHTHTCVNGHTWDHTMDNGSHRCPVCGAAQYVQDSTPRMVTKAVRSFDTVRVQVPASSAAAVPDCPPATQAYFQPAPAPVQAYQPAFQQSYQPAYSVGLAGAGGCANGACASASAGGSGGRGGFFGRLFGRFRR